MPELSNNNNIKTLVLIKDFEFFTAVMYRYKIPGYCTYKDSEGVFYLAFNNIYKDLLENAWAEYLDGRFEIPMPGYVEYRDEAEAEWLPLLGNFDVIDNEDLQN